MNIILPMDIRQDFDTLPSFFVSQASQTLRIKKSTIQVSVLVLLFLPFRVGLKYLTLNHRITAQSRTLSDFFY